MLTVIDVLDALDRIKLDRWFGKEKLGMKKEKEKKEKGKRKR
jgi:hypothetical protein